MVGAVQAAEFEVKIVNNTGVSFFTPLLVVTHAHDTQLLKTGMAASSSLQAMAEGGNIAHLVADLNRCRCNTIVENPAAGLLAPGAHTMAALTTDASHDSLSLVAMILPTNYGFIAPK